MNKTQIGRGIVAALMVAVAGPALAAPKSAPVELFGVTLKGATREQLRAALKRGGVKATREDDDHWCDQYDPSAVLEGATQLNVCYVRKSAAFALAGYTFNSFMDSEQVTRISKLVSGKYGAPASHQGNDGLGEVTYRWSVPGGIDVWVERGWPDTSSTLVYMDRGAKAQLDGEQAVVQAAQNASKARAQSKAF
jgi:hypothetical protein